MKILFSIGILPLLHSLVDGLKLENTCCQKVGVTFGPLTLDLACQFISKQNSRTHNIWGNYSKKGVCNRPLHLQLVLCICAFVCVVISLCFVMIFMLPDSHT